MQYIFLSKKKLMHVIMRAGVKKEFDKILACAKFWTTTSL